MSAPSPNGGLVAQDGGHHFTKKMFSTEHILPFFIALVTGDFLGMFIFEIAGIGAFLCILAIL